MRPPALLALACAVVCALAACKSTPELQWKDVIQAANEQPGPPPPTEPHLVVYLDTSYSMAGYVSPNDRKVEFGAQPDKHTVFTHTLRAIRDEATTAAFDPPVNIAYREVTAQVSPPVFNDVKLAEAAVSRAIYKGGETNLAGAVSLFDDPVAPAGDAGAASPTPTPPPGLLHILVTDGVQSTTQQRTNMNCVTGSDSVCVKNAISSLLRQGWSACVLGVRSEFNGKVYSEVKKGHAVEHASTGDITTYRPFYLYIFSPNREALDKFVASMKRRIRQIAALKAHEPAEGEKGSNPAVREYALTSAYSAGPVKAELVEESRHLSKMRGRDDETSPRLTLKVSVDTEQGGVGPQEFSVMVTVPWSEHARDTAPPQDLPGMLNWSFEEVRARGDGGANSNANGANANANGASVNRAGGSNRLPEIVYVSSQPTGDGRVEVKAKAYFPPGTGDPAWRAYKLVARLNLERPVPPWVADWSVSSDLTREEANRTFNLESSLANLWNNQSLQKQLVAEVYIRVGPS